MWHAPLSSVPSPGSFMECRKQFTRRLFLCRRMLNENTRQKSWKFLELTSSCRRALLLAAACWPIAKLRLAPEPFLPTALRAGYLPRREAHRADVYGQPPALEGGLRQIGIRFFDQTPAAPRYVCQNSAEAMHK